MLELVSALSLGVIAVCALIYAHTHKENRDHKQRERARVAYGHSKFATPVLRKLAEATKPAIGNPAERLAFVVAEGQIKDWPNETDKAYLQYLPMQGLPAPQALRNVAADPDRLAREAAACAGITAVHLGQSSAAAKPLPHWLAGYPLTPGKYTYTIGLSESADIQQPAPDRLFGATLILATGLRMPLELISAEEWAKQQAPHVTGIPRLLYLRTGFPVASLCLFPVPNAEYRLLLNGDYRRI